MSKPTNATPEPLSDEELGILALPVCYQCGRLEGDCQSDPDNVVPKDGSRHPFRPSSQEAGADTLERLLTTINYFKAQPAPVPLAEDEALIADLEYIAQEESGADVPGIYARQILAASKRLSLRSRQLAQAKKWIASIFRESGPGSHPGRTPEEAANEIIEGASNA